MLTEVRERETELVLRGGLHRWRVQHLLEVVLLVHRGVLAQGAVVGGAEDVLGKQVRIQLFLRIFLQFYLRKQQQILLKENLEQRGKIDCSVLNVPFIKFTVIKDYKKIFFTCSTSFFLSSLHILLTLIASSCSRRASLRWALPR